MQMLTSRIRTETQASHQALENSLLLSPLAKTLFISPEEYIQILTGLYAVMADLEDHINESLVYYKSPKKYYMPCTDNLLLDIETLVSGAIKLSKQNVCTVNSEEQFMAALYIQKGSKLGSKLILKNLQHSSSCLPVQYFTECSKCNSDWKIFCDELNKNNRLNQDIFIESLLSIYHQITDFFNS